MGTSLQDCGQAERELLARLATPVRNRYYYGKLLDAYHLELEQRYGNNKRWLINRLTLGSGVLCGLGVTADAERRRVRVEPGVAVDGVGREIVVPEPSIGIDPRQPTDDCGRADGEPVRGDEVVTLYVCWHECEAEPSPVLVSACGPERTCEHGLHRERYRLRVARGEPGPFGSLTPEQCARIFGRPVGEARRRIVCETVGGGCAPPDETCVALAVIRFDANGRIARVDECGGRRTIYSNAVLLDLILCLAARVDECCAGTPPTRVRSIVAVSGDAQSAPAGQPVPQPLVARVDENGSPVPNASVTFAIVPPGGALGDDPATLGASFAVSTDAQGLAKLPVWRLGANPGTQRVTASIASGTPSSVTFSARAERVQVDLPVVLRIWPRNAVRLLRDTNDQTIRTWAEQLARRPRIEVTFDHEMSAAQLGQPDPWLRVVVVRPRGDEALVRRVPLGHDGRAPQPMMPGPGFTETFTLRDLQPGELKEAWWIVMMRAEGGNIVDTGAPPQLLDADYLGVELTPEDLDKLWNVTVPQGMGDLIPRIGDTGATLPQSGDGTAGGRFASWFSVLGVGP